MRGRRSRGRKSGPSTVTIPVQATSVGAVSANQFAGWTHSAGTITNGTAYGVTANYFNFGTSSTVDVQSKAVSRDHEVEFWAYTHRAYIRIADGKALRAQVGGGEWVVEFVSIGSSGYESDTVIAQLGLGTISGFNGSDTDGDTYVFGAEGFEVYLKWNGTDQFREKQIFHNKPGRVGFRHELDSPFSGLRICTATFKASVPLYSTPDFKRIDVRDFGVFPYATTGSMTAGSTTLTVASNPGFAIGDPIIVEIGGESGAGARGTRGVGGQWPTLVYADAAARNADTSQLFGMRSGTLDTGDVYIWRGTYWDQETYSHFNKICPKALVTTITNISGTTFTLADAAVVSTTNANVYLNAAEKYAEIIGATYFQLDSYISDFTILWTAGNFAWGYTGGLPKGFGSSRINWDVQGISQAATAIFSPNGTAPLQVGAISWTGGSIHDMSFDSNCTIEKGYLAQYNETTDFPQEFFYNLRIETCDNTEVYNVSTSEHQSSGISVSYSNRVNVYDCTVTHTTGHRNYFQWAFAFANSTNCTANNIVLDFDKLTCAFEQFQCLDCTFTNFTARNAQFSVNSSQSWIYSSIVVTIEEDCASGTDYDWMLTGSPVFNINSNINNQQGSGGYNYPGLFEDFTIIQEGKAQVSGTGTFPWVNGVINLNGYVSDITLQGDFPAKPTTNGYIEVPASYPGLIINDNDPFDSTVGKNRTVLDGIRVKGGVTVPSVKVSNATSSVINCVLDAYETGGTDTGNITNAAYDAL